jgi:hypothetical protein
MMHLFFALIFDFNFGYLHIFIFSHYFRCQTRYLLCLYLSAKYLNEFFLIIQYYFLLSHLFFSCFFSISQFSLNIFRFGFISKFANYLGYVLIYFAILINQTFENND